MREADSGNRAVRKPYQLAVLFFIVSLSLTAFAGDPLIFHRDGHCPPHPIPDRPIEGSDIFAPGPPLVVKAWLVYRYHWDDGKGNDLTVDSLCITEGEYMSVRVTQSKNGRLTVVAQPGGGNGTADPGHC